MNGQPCPLCGQQDLMLSTANEWVYCCRPCGIRFNAQGEVMPLVEQILEMGFGSRERPYTSTIRQEIDSHDPQA